MVGVQGDGGGVRQPVGAKVEQWRSLPDLTSGDIVSIDYSEARQVVRSAGSETALELLVADVESRHVDPEAETRVSGASATNGQQDRGLSAGLTA